MSGDILFDQHGWYALAKRIVSPNFNQRPDVDDISLLVIHCISLPRGNYNGDCVEKFFINRLDVSIDPSLIDLENSKVSAHFYIRRDGRIIQFVSIYDRAWHAGVSCYRGRDNCNDYAIGIELEGVDDDRFETQQYQTLTALTLALSERFPRLSDHIVGHSDIAPGRKTDPGSGFDWRRYREEFK
ncbi:MAG: 1,6-anhydro-N-acetylmuramyl-L-alanine amidase AmpD [Francisellaceae bacterium]